MNALLKLLTAISNLTRAGGLRNIEQVYKLAKRELGDKFGAAKKQIDDAFKQGKEQKKLDDRTKDVKKIDEQGIKSVETEQSELMKRLEDKVKNIANVENISTGLTRTIAREILLRRGIDVPKGRDALELFREKFGQDVLLDVNNLAEELVEMDRMGKKPKSLTQIIEQEGFFDLKMPKEPPQGYTPDELAEIQKEIDQEDILLKFDPTGRKANATGGIMRANYKIGTGIKLAKFLASKGKNLKDEIKNAVDNIFPTGDSKYDADVALDSMLEELDVDRDMFDQKDIIDAYGMAYDNLVAPIIKNLKTPKGKRPKKSIKSMKETGSINISDPEIAGEFDRFVKETDPEGYKKMEEAIKKAAEEAQPLDYVLGTRKKNSEGGPNYSNDLSQITSLYEKIRMNNVQKQKDASDNKQMRFRKLLASNKFPELNTFLEAELNEDGEKVELDVRTNLAIGGSPFTPDQIAQRKQQSYVDYLARQGVGQSGTTTGPAPVFNPFTGTSTTPPASGGSQPGTGSPGTGGGGGGTTQPNLGDGKPRPTIPGGGGGSTGGGSTGGGSTGGSGGGTSGGSNLYTGANNFPPGMGPGSGGSTPGSGGGSGLTPNTGNSNVGGGGFGGTGSIVGGGTGSAPGYQSRLDEYKAYVERNKNDPRAVLTPNSFFTQKELMANPEMQDAAYKDIFNPAKEFQKQVQSGYDTGDLGSEEANDAAYRGDPNSHPDYLAFKQMSSKEQRALLEPFMDRARAEVGKGPPSQRNFENVLGYAKEYYRDSLMGADANDGFDDGLKKSTYDEEAEDDFETFTDDEGNKRISKDMYDQAQYDFFKEQGKIPEDASLEEFKSGKFAGATYSPRDENLNKSFKDHLDAKYGTSSTLSPKTETAYQQVGGGGDFAQITSLPETSNFAQQISSKKDPKEILRTANEFATKHGKTLTAASYLLDAAVPGAGKIIRTALTLNKGYNMLTGSRDAAMDEALNNPQTTQPQSDDLFNKGSESLQFMNQGGRVNKAIGGSLDLEARKKQSQADFLARQPGAQPVQPQPPAVNPQPPAVNPQPPAVNPQPPAVNPQPPAAPQPFDMSKYQGGTFTGGIEDSRNIALDQLAGMGVDTSKYAKMTATDTSGPKFKGLSINEIFAMDEQTARDKLGFDPSDPDASPEFEEFLRVNDPGPQLLGPGGPPGMKTEFTNQDELAQILNRAIPYYMRTARDLGENYTLEEMLAMSDDDLAMLDDRYNKKMGYGKYRTSYVPNTGSRDKSQVQETMEQYKDIQRQGTGIGLGSQYAKGGRVNFKYGSDRYGQSKKVMSAMNVDYNDPFKKLMSNDSGRFIKSTSSLTRYAKNLSKLKNSKQAKTALRKNLLVKNEKARKDALKRLSLLQKMYAGGKKSV